MNIDQRFHRYMGLKVAESADYPSLKGPHHQVELKVGASNSGWLVQVPPLGGVEAASQEGALPLFFPFVVGQGAFLSKIQAVCPHSKGGVGVGAQQSPALPFGFVYLPKSQPSKGNRLMAHTKYVKDGKEENVPEFSFFGALFGPLYLLVKGTPKYAAVLFIGHLALYAFTMVFSAMLGHSGDDASFAYTGLAFLIDGFLTTSMVGSHLEEQGWTKKS